MPFIGNQPALSYTSFAKQDFTTSATTSYTLDHPVTNENEIALFINFVRQEPTTAYTASGTTLTLTSATSASDDMYCVFLGKAVQTVNPPSGSVGISQLSATGTKDSTTFLRGDNTFASAGGTNTPAFEVIKSSSQTITDGSTTKITFDTEIFDTANVYDTSTSKFTVPSGQAGKYFIYSGLTGQSGTSGQISDCRNVIYKNGSQYKAAFLIFGGTTGYFLSLNTYSIMDLSVGDYIEVYGLVNVGSGSALINADAADNRTYFGAYKLLT